jgi:MFS transporter, ACS family, hexuronate transporter
MRKIPHIRWWVAGLLFGAAVLNYIDRQTLSILAPTIQADLKLDDYAYARVVNLFLVAYTVALLVSGRLVDKVGSRIGLAVFVTWWSVANMLTALATSARSLGMFRFMLGLGEAGNWTASPKAVSEWFPAKERGLAIGIYTMGATIGATIAPIIIVAVASRWHWQATFFVTGALGLLWVIPWLWLYRRPAEHPRITDAERQLLVNAAETAPEPEAPVNESELSRWKAVLGRSDVWVLAIGRMLTDPVWYFYQFWLAKYLFSARGVAQEDLKVTWVVFLAADIGALAGGWASGIFIKRGTSATNGRLLAMLICAALVPLSPLVAYAPSVWMSLAVAMIVVLAHMSWLINISALVVDVMPKRYLATAFGVVAAASAVGGIMMNKLVAALVTDYSYTHAFVIMAVLHPTVWVLLWLVIGRRNPVDPQGFEVVSPSKAVHA